VAVIAAAAVEGSSGLFVSVAPPFLPSAPVTEDDDDETPVKGALDAVKTDWAAEILAGT